MSGPQTAHEARPEVILPPAVERPERVSQTLLRHFTECHRSAALYMARGGGAGSHEKHRGIVFHTFAENAVKLMIELGEATIPADVAKDLLGEAIREHRDLALPADEADWLRIMAFHFAQGTVIDEPARTVAGVEQLIHLELGGFVLSGKLDLTVNLPDGRLLIRDYKTDWNVPTQEDFERSFQTPLYAVLLSEGTPVERVREACWNCASTDQAPDLCSSCAGTGYTVRFERGFAPLGQHAPEFVLENVYVRYYKDEFGIRTLRTTIDRGRVQDHRLWLEDELYKFAAAFEDGSWPATEGSHCGRCPSRPECPLPAALRGEPFDLVTEDDARRAATKHFFEDDTRSRTWEQLRAWVSQHGPLRFGEDFILDFREDASETIKSKPKLWAAIERAVEYGEDFSPADHLKERRQLVLRKRQLTAEERSTDERGSNGNGGHE